MPPEYHNHKYETILLRSYDIKEAPVEITMLSSKVNWSYQSGCASLGIGNREPNSRSKKPQRVSYYVRCAHFRQPASRKW